MKGNLSAGMVSCTFSVPVTSATPGTFVNGYPNGNYSKLVGLEGGQNATVKFDGAPGIPSVTNSFNPTELPVAQVSRLTFTVTNSSDLLAKTGWSFTNTRPPSSWWPTRAG